MLKSAIIAVQGGGTLDRTQAEAVMTQIMDGGATDAQIAALLTSLRWRGETVDELVGFARAMRSKVTRVATSRPNLVDTCGTGGGGVSTFNVSTAAAIVAAAAGVNIAKHGNRAMTSKSGSADVLEALGIALAPSPEAVGRCLDELGIGFLFAPALHPAMKHAIGPRREIGIRTVFNLLGPLTNPAGADAQVIGVPEPQLADLLIEVLAELGARRALVVHGLLGVDELSIEGPSRVCELRDGWFRKRELTPEEAGVPSASLKDVAGGDATANAAMIEAVLAGQAGPHREFVVLNAAAAIVVGSPADSLTEGANLAREALDSGAAKAKLDAWREWSRNQ